MKYLDEFRDGELARRLAAEIRARTTRPWAIMEVCGGQTHSIIRNGVDQLLPEEIEMIHGPGCPVCVTPIEMIDRALAIAARPEVIFCSFGDMLRVPGSTEDLFQVRSEGGDVRIVYSPLDAVQLARVHPERQVVFFGIGFETTAPANAMAVHLARQQGLMNFSMLVSHVLVPPAIDAIMSSPDNRVQAFLAAGHVCSVMGTWQYPALVERHQVPIVVTGFEPLDLLEGIRRAVDLLESGRSELDNAYARVVSEKGNVPAQKLLSEVFEVTDRAWRASARSRPAAGSCPRPTRISTPRRASRSATSGRVNRRSAVAARSCKGRSSPRMRRLRQGMHAAQAPGGDDGVVGRRLRRLLQLRALLERPKRCLSMSTDAFSWSCPLPLRDYPSIVLGHGGGGQLSSDLVEHLFVPAFGDPELARLGDAAVLPGAAGRLALSTDSFVVHPLFFPGGSIGDLAVHGTVNDLAMTGAEPLYLSAGFILEEGLPIETLAGIVHRMAEAAKKAGVAVVTGDTKVVEKGHGHGCYINTAGVGRLRDGVDLGPEKARPGDRVIVSGTLGDHGMAVMSVREGLEFDTDIRSDSAALNGLVSELLDALDGVCTGGVHVLRDPTRGGLAASLNEIAAAAKVGVELVEEALPVRSAVRSACELLGMDPLHVANEGKLVAIVAEDTADAALTSLRRHPLGSRAAVIGRVVDGHPGVLAVRTPLGARRVVPMQIGEQLPRIC